MDRKPKKAKQKLRVQIQRKSLFNSVLEGSASSGTLTPREVLVRHVFLDNAIRPYPEDFGIEDFVNSEFSYPNQKLEKYFRSLSILRLSEELKAAVDSYIRPEPTYDSSPSNSSEGTSSNGQGHMADDEDSSS